MITFSDADIRASATSQTYSRGYEYYHQGAVSDLTRRGSVLTAQVEGSQYEPYEVVVTLAEDGGIQHASCSCPYDRGGYCKHIVAVLLAALGDEAQVKPDLEALLASLSEAQLRRILRGMAEDQPGLIATIEREAAWVKMEPVAGAGPTPAAEPSITIDIAAIQREMHKDFRRIGSTGGGYGERYWEYDEASDFDANEVLGPHVALAQRLLDASDPVQASAVLHAVIDAWQEGIAELDEWIAEANPDVFSDAGAELAALLAEALLSQDLSPDQRQQWLDRLDDWDEEIIDLELLAAALEQWWDYPPLVAAMQGHISKQGAREEEASDSDDELTLARLRILERQGRIQEYIHLAEAEGQTSLYVNMLARSGQVEKAVVEAREYITSPQEILALARILAAQGQAAAALAVADHGLKVPIEGRKQELGRWTAALAQQQGNSALALRAAQAAFLSGFDLADFKLAEGLARAEWPPLKASLLAAMAASHHYRKTEIYLYEGMLVEAMAVIDREPYSSGLEQVIQATRAQYPDWGIGKCKRRAEAIMDAAKAKDYDTAVSWLRSARDIYLQHGRQADWGAYLSGLLEVHGRKYKLVPMLKGIR